MPLAAGMRPLSDAHAFSELAMRLSTMAALWTCIVQNYNYSPCMYVRSGPKGAHQFDVIPV